MRTEATNQRPMTTVTTTTQKEVKSQHTSSSSFNSRQENYQYDSWETHKTTYKGSVPLSSDKPAKGSAGAYRNGIGQTASKLGNLAKSVGFTPSVSGSTSASASVVDENFNVSTSGDWGSAQASGSIKFIEAHAGAQGSAGIDGGNLYAQGRLEAGVNLINAQGQAHVHLEGMGDLDVKGHVVAGANGEIHGSVVIGEKGVHANIGGKAFAGVEANVQGRWTTVEGASVQGSVGVKAGIGVEGELNVGLKDGKLDFKLEFGIAIGVGFKVSLNFSIDFNKLGKAIGNFFSKLFGGQKSGQKQLPFNDVGEFGQLFEGLFKALEQLNKEREELPSKQLSSPTQKPSPVKNSQSIPKTPKIASSGTKPSLAA